MPAELNNGTNFLLVDFDTIVALNAVGGRQALDLLFKAGNSRVAMTYDLVEKLMGHDFGMTAVDPEIRLWLGDNLLQHGINITPGSNAGGYEANPITPEQLEAASRSRIAEIQTYEGASEILLGMSENQRLARSLDNDESLSIQGGSNYFVHYFQGDVDKSDIRIQLLYSDKQSRNDLIANHLSGSGNIELSAEELNDNSLLQQPYHGLPEFYNDLLRNGVISNEEYASARNFFRTSAYVEHTDMAAFMNDVELSSFDYQELQLVGAVGPLLQEIDPIDRWINDFVVVSGGQTALTLARARNSGLMSNPLQFETVLGAAYDITISAGIQKGREYLLDFVVDRIWDFSKDFANFVAKETVAYLARAILPNKAWANAFIGISESWTDLSKKISEIVTIPGLDIPSSPQSYLTSQIRKLIKDIIEPVVDGVLESALDNTLGADPRDPAARRAFIADMTKQLGGALDDQVGSDRSSLFVAYTWQHVTAGASDDFLFGISPFVAVENALYDPNNPDSGIVTTERTMRLDGGAGNDWVFVFGGDRATTIGGMGRDIVANFSKGGVIYGDTIDGLTPFGLNINSEVRNDRYGVVAQQTADMIMFAPRTILMDPGHNDVLSFFGYPLVGGTNELADVLGLPKLLANPATFATFASPIFFDAFFPFIQYYQMGEYLFVINLVDSFATADDIIDNPTAKFDELQGIMVIKNFEAPPRVFWGGSYFVTSNENSPINPLLAGDLGMLLKMANPIFGLFQFLSATTTGGIFANVLPTLDRVLTLAAFADQVLAQLKWFAHGTDFPQNGPSPDGGGDGPPSGSGGGGGGGDGGSNSGWSIYSGVGVLVLDLGPVGLETLSIDPLFEDTNVFFDMDGDSFAERTGWLSGDDGFLVRDLDHDGKIENITEMFGGPGRSGLADLAEYDLNGDGRIDVADLVYSELQVWRDIDGDGQTDAGELFSLEALGIVSLSVEPNPSFNGPQVTPQGTTLAAQASFTWSDGRFGEMFDAIFEVNDVDTHFAGDAGIATWLGDDPVSARGFGEIADLAIAMSNDLVLKDLVEQAAATMTVANLTDMRHKSAAALGQWGFTLETTRELTPVLLSADGKSVLAKAVWVEVGNVGHWQMPVGHEVRDAQGAIIAQPSLEQILAQGGGWKLEQMFSPSDRAQPLTVREEVPYLVQVVNGRAVITDHAVHDVNGWRLASGTPVLDAQGNVITNPTKEQILAQSAAAGFEWRVEDIGFQPLADLPVDEIGVYQVDGVVVDYTVLVQDELGSFHVWARALDQALELQDKVGNARGFDLRAYAVNFAELDIVESEVESAYRVEVLTPGQFNFATQLSGITFNPAMLMATIDATTGVIDYSVNDTGSPSLSETSYVSAIKAMIELLDPIMDQYIESSRAFALRLAVQGGLADEFAGIGFDAAKDQFYATTNQSLAPLYKAIFDAAPAGAVATEDYLKGWHQILSVMYPDFRMPGQGNLFGSSVALDQRFIFQMMLGAFQSAVPPMAIDLKNAMDCLGVNQDLLKSGTALNGIQSGSTGVDFFLVGDGATAYQGGKGGDVYVAGKNFGTVEILDIDGGSPDELRFTDVASDQVIANRIGQDLILTVQGRPGQITVKDHFLGELNISGPGYTEDRSMKAIIFSDGVLWDQFRIAMAVSHPLDSDDVIEGSGALDVLNGGKGNDELRGSTGGDLYIFARGDGDDIVDDFNPTNTGPGKGGLDFIQFRGDVSADDLRLSRTGESDHMLIELLDDQGQLTGDSILVKDQFDGMRLNLGAFLGGIDPSLGIDYVAPNLIEKFLFEDGSWLDYDQFTQRILDSARTDGSDIIYGFIDVDVFGGGAGNDLLIGREGGDTYTFGRGDGVDEIEDLDMSVKLFGAPDDWLQFEDGVTWGDLDFIRVGGSDTLTLRIAGTTDEVILKDQEASFPFIGFFNLIERIQFGDGTVWTYNQLFQHFIDLSQTDANDTVYGFHTADLINGGLGDDYLIGQGGSDTYTWTTAAGSDRILDAGGDDRLILSGIASTDVSFERDKVNTDNLILRVISTGETITLENQYVREGAQGYAVEYLEFSDRVVTFTDINPEDLDLIGTNLSETLTGTNFVDKINSLGGDDTMIGGSDGDIYVFDAGHGHDVIYDRQLRASWPARNSQTAKETTDRVEFGPDLLYANASFSKVGNSLQISFSDRPDTLLIQDHFAGILTEIETFVFADRVATAADIEQRLAITGANRGDNDLGNAGATLAQALDGRQGNDTLRGGLFADNFSFGVGYGFDTVLERNDAAGVTDKVIFGEGVALDDLLLRRDVNDLLIDLGNGEDVLRIVGGLTTTSVEEFHFADGSIVSLDAMKAKLLVGSDGNDKLEGFVGNDRLAGGKGSDELIGLGGNDTFVFGHGDGQDSVLDSAGTDRIEFGTGVTRDQVTFELVGNDLVIRLKPGNDSLVVLGGAGNGSGRVEEFAFTDGTVLDMGDVQTLIFATRGNGSSDLVDARTLPSDLQVRPGQGLDSVILSTHTKYLFVKGDGYDRVSVADSLDAHGEIRIEGYAASEARVRLTSSQGTDLLVSFDETGEGILLAGALSGAKFPDIVFEDGTIWTRAALIQQMVDGQTTDGDDVIRGPGTTGVTIEGGLGDDDIFGGTGVDTFRFSRGDGRDVIYDLNGINERLEITGYVNSDMRVTVSQTSGLEIILSFVGTDDEIVLRSSPTSGPYNGANLVVFSDGTTLNIDQLLALAATYGTPGDDNILGTTASEVFTGGLGDDTINGGSVGDDVIHYTLGDGVDYIHDGSSNDKLMLHGVGPGEIRVTRTNDYYNYILEMPDGGRVHLYYLYTVGEIHFDNGTKWTYNNLPGLAEAKAPQSNQATTAAHGFVSSDADQVIVASNSSWARYTFNPGFGQDDLAGNSGSVFNPRTETVLFTGRSLADAQFAFDPLNYGALIVTFANSPDRLVARGIENFEFQPLGGGAVETLTAAQAANLAMQALATSGADDISIGGNDATLAGGLGDDTISYNSYGTTVELHFAAGDGQDLIIGHSLAARIVIHGYQPGELSVSVDPVNPRAMVLRLGANDQITWNPDEDYYYEDFGYGAPTLVFADASNQTITPAMLIAMVSETPINGTSANDTVFGTLGHDRLDAGAGDDLILGQKGEDVLVFGPGTGHDAAVGKRFEYYGEGGTASLDGHYSIAVQGYTPADIRIISSLDYNSGLMIESRNGSDSIYLESTFLKSITFQDGTVWGANEIYLHSVNSRIGGIEGRVIFDPASGDPVGTAADDALIFDLSAAGVHELHYNRNSGHDWLGLRPVYSSNILTVYMDGINFSEVAVYGTSGSGIILTFGEIGASLTTEYMYGEATFVFADGVTRTWAELQGISLGIHQHPGWVETGSLDIDAQVDGGIYYFASYEGGINITGVDPADLTYKRLGQDIIITVPEDAANGVLASEIHLMVAYDVHGLTVNGTLVGLLSALFDQYPPKYVTPGVLENDLPEAPLTEGDDGVLTFGDQVLEGGGGDDVIHNTDGTSTLVYRNGDGDDAIVATGYDNSYPVLDETVTQDLPTTGPMAPVAGVLDLTSVNYFTVLFQVIGDAFGFRLTEGVAPIDEPRAWLLASDVHNQAGPTSALTEIHFADGVVFDVADFIATWNFPIEHIGDLIPVNRQLDLSDQNPYDVHLTGFMDGNGNRTAELRVYAPISEQTYQNFDLTPGLRSFDTVLFANGVVISVDDMIAGPWAIEDFYQASYSSDDILDMPDLLASDISFARDRDDLVITVIADPARGIEAGSIRLTDAFVAWEQRQDFLNGYYSTSPDYIETIRFADASELDLGTIFDGLRNVGTPGRDKLYATDSVEVLNGGAGDDLLVGSNHADAANDTFIGGLGNDSIDLDASTSETVVYARGDGHDQIELHIGLSVTLQLQGIAANQLSVERIASQTRLIIAESLPGAGDGGSLLLFGQPSSLTVNLDNGTAITWSELMTRALADANNPESWSIGGSGAAETISGGGGNDTLTGGGGMDTFVYTRGDGFDTIFDARSTSGDADTLVLHGIRPEDVQLKRTAVDTLSIIILGENGVGGIEGRIFVNFGLYNLDSGFAQIVFDNGTVWNRAEIDVRIAAASVSVGSDRIIGSEGADTITGGLGDDLLEGRGGDDTYVFTKGDGHEQIIETTGNDTLRLVGFDRDDVIFDRRGLAGRDLLIRSVEGNDLITISNGLDPAKAIEQVVFEPSGTTISLAQILDGLTAALATSGDDVIYGTPAAETMTGDTGSDVLNGGAGSDIYDYDSGDGDDRIGDSGTEANDRLILDINASQLGYAARLAPNADDLVLRLPGAQDRIILEGALSQGNGGVDEIQFADGTIWTKAIMRQQTLTVAQTAGNDNLWGFAAADAFDMGAGNDTATGGLGSDTYTVQRGDGQDRIIEATDAASIDRINFADYVSSEISIARLFKGSNDIIMTFLSSGDSVTIENALATDGSGIEVYHFSDGVDFSRVQLEARLDNTAPEATRDGYFSVISGTPLVIPAATLLRNDFDPDGETVLMVRADGGTAGTAEINAQGALVFNAAPGVYGPVQISYTISDGHGGFDTGTIDLRIRPVAQAVDDSGFTAAEGGSLFLRSEQLLANDLDGDHMVIGQVLNPVGGTVAIDSNGNITFVVAADFNGQASFSYIGNTPDNGIGQATVRINVTPVNDAPVARTDGTFTFDENTGIVIDPATLLANDSDIDSAVLTISSVTSNADILVSLDALGQIQVTPRPEFFGNAYFDYTITDSAGATATGRVNLFVTAVNSAPVAVGDSEVTAEDTPIFTAFTELLANDSDADGDLLTVDWAGNADGGEVRFVDNGVLFTPWNNFNGQAFYDYRINDGQGGTRTARVDIQIDAVNDYPAAGDDHYGPARAYLSGTEDTPLVINIADLMINDSDVESITLTFQTASNPIGGTLTLPGNGTIVFTPDQDFWGDATFSYLVTDPEGLPAAGQVTLFFANVDDAPPVAVTDIFQVVEDTPTIIPIAALLANDTDIDRDTITYVAAYTSIFTNHGSMAYNENGDLVFTPGRDRTQTTEFIYTITDGNHDPVAGRIVIDMIPVNDEPDGGDDTPQGSELNVPLVIRVSDLLLNDDDIDGPYVSFAGVASLSTGSYEVVDNQFIVVRVAPNYFGPIVLDYILTDGSLTDTARITTSILPTYDHQIDGSARIDLLIGTADAETIRGEGDNDTLFGEDGDDLLIGGAGGDEIHGGLGYDTVDFSESTFDVSASLASRSGQGGHAQGDEYFDIESLIGSVYNDTLQGSSVNNLLIGGLGNDQIVGLDGVDTLQGGDGADTLVGGEGGDLIEGGDGLDGADYSASTSGVQISLANGTATGGAAAGDTLVSIEGLYGSEFADNLEGTSVGNFLQGGRGNDTLIGGDGDDTLSGGRDADVLVGGAGIDIADYAQSTTGVTVNMANGASSSGDAQGDTFSGIEIVQGSYFGDVLIGDASDNRLRGGVGADTLDGGAGFDTADYSTATEAVAVDLGLGQGTAGEALGDVLSNIDRLLGTNWNDTFLGGAGDEVFDAGLGNDNLSGGGGSDTYVFGFDAGNDTISEGEAIGIDLVVLQAPVRSQDVSFVRQGDDLLIELENLGGFLTDTLTVTGQFAGAATGVEQVAFADGRILSRADIEALTRLGRFNAVDDLVRFQTEDVPVTVSAASLVANDASEGVENLQIIAVNGIGGATATLNGDGTITFQGALNQNGDAFFDYVVRDGFGRESTARVEVNLTPVNDAPVAVADGPFTGIEDTILSIPLASLLGNDSDVEGDALSIVNIAPLLDIDGNPLYSGATFNLTNGRGGVDALTGVMNFEPRTDHFGLAGFRYRVGDGNGGVSDWVDVILNFVAVNDAPRGDDSANVRLDMVNVISLATLLGNDFDPEDDSFAFGSLIQGVNGTATLSADGLSVEFVANALGGANFQYTLIDSLGEVGIVTVDLTVRPLNDPPHAQDDGGFETYEDQAILIDPALLLANDSDPNGDVLTISWVDEFADNGRAEWAENGMIRFVPRPNYNGDAGFNYQISDGRGGFDMGRVTLTIVPRNEAPLVRHDVASGVEDEIITILAGEVFGNDLDPDGDVIFFNSVSVIGILGGLNAPRPVADDFAFTADKLAPGTQIVATLADGSALPATLTFDALTLSFAGALPEGVSTLDLLVTFTLPANLGGHQFTQTMTVDTANAAALADVAGLALDIDTALFELDPKSLFGDIAAKGAFSGGFNPATYDFAPGVWSALDSSGRDLPTWVIFDATTMSVSIDAALMPVDAQPVTVRITHTPEAAQLRNGYLSTVDGALALDIVVDPAVGVDPAFNTMLQTQAFFAAQGLMGLPVDAGTPMTVTLANGGPLPSWLSFDPATLTFTGTPPAGDYVGALDVRITPAAGPGIPAFSIVAELVVDPVFATNSGSGFGGSVLPDRLFITAPEDFDGSFALLYTATDTIGAVSNPAIMVVNVSSTREKPDAGMDEFYIGENAGFTALVTDLLANDVDDDGDAIWISGFATPARGTITVTEAVLTRDLAAQTGLGGAGAVWSATLADGSALPAWAVLDTVTGILSMTVPLAYQGDLALSVAATVDGTTTTAAVSESLNGNIGASVTYTRPVDYLSQESFGYTVTDGNPEPYEGAAQGVIHVVANSNPRAMSDDLDAVEDTSLDITVASLLANDSDADGDTLTLTSIGLAQHGTLTLVDGTITYVPDHNYDGSDTFIYTISDGRGGFATGAVRISVASTNVAPVVVGETYAGIEDTPIFLDVATLLSNDSDANGDTLTLLSITSEIADGVVLRTQDGNWSFQPNVNLNGTVTLTYEVTDGRERVTGTITVNLAAVNDAPIIRPDAAVEVYSGGSITFDMATLLANDYDPEGDSFTVIEVYDPDEGTVAMVGQTVTFTARAGYTGNAGFRYVMSDSHGATIEGYAEMQVLPAVLAPIAISDALTVNEDTPLILTPAQLMANDIDPNGGTLTFVGFTGGVTNLGDGTYLYMPPTNNASNVVLTYQITNASGVVVSASVLIDILPMPDAPVAVADTVLTVENQLLTIDPNSLLANDFDVDNQGLTITSVQSGVGVTVMLVNGMIELVPATNRDTAGNFTYTVTDGDGLTAVGQVTVNITPVNSAPVLAAPLSDRNATEDVAFSIALQSMLFSDPDGDELTYSLTMGDGSALPAWISFNPLTQTISGTPPLNFFGDVMLRLHASDGTSSISDDFALRVNGTSDAPVLAHPLADVATDAAGAAIEVNKTFTFNADLTAFSDPDSTALAYSARLASGAALPSWLVFNGTTFNGTPPAGTAGTLQIELLATDGTDTVSDVFQLTIAPGTFNVINGTSAANTLNGTAGNDQINGLAGNDTIRDNDGNDEVYGGDGNDSMTAGAGRDFYDGGAGDDRVFYTAATAGLTINLQNANGSTGIALGDTFANIERIHGSNFDDVIIGSTVQRLLGEAGNDFIRDGSGAELLTGGAGNDWFQMLAGDGAQDRITDFVRGQDVIDLSLWGVTSFDQLTIAERVNGQGVPQGDLIISYGNQSLRLDGYNASTIPTLNAAHFFFEDPMSIPPDRWAGLTVLGTSTNDLIDDRYRDANGIGISGGGQTIDAGGGADTIFNGGGADNILAGTGNDTIHGGPGADTIDGGAGTDMLTYANAQGGVLVDLTGVNAHSGAATGHVISAIEGLTGSDYTDVLIGNSTLTTMAGRAGDDYLRDGTGRQTLTGGSGMDTFAFLAGDGQRDIVSDFVIGEDKIDLSAWGVTSRSQLTISVTNTNQMIVRFGSEQIRLDGHTTADIAAMTSDQFIFATPAAPQFAPTPSAPSTPTPAPQARGLAAPSTSSTPVSEAGFILHFAEAAAQAAEEAAQLAQPTQITSTSSFAALSSYIVGDELAQPGQIATAGAAAGAATGASGALVDPATTVQAFLSATQLAALDHDQFSFF